MQDHIRMSDADRDQVAGRLREHFAEGRLDQEEFDQRLTATMNAKTFGDMRGIMADLPEPGTPWQQAEQPSWQQMPFPPPVAMMPRAVRPVQVRRGPRLLPMVALIIVIGLILPGPVGVAFGFIKLMLLVWLVLGIGGIFASRARQQDRQRARSRSSYSSWQGRRF